MTCDYFSLIEFIKAKHTDLHLPVATYTLQYQ